jgi:hypothetical protein
VEAVLRGAVASARAANVAKTDVLLWSVNEKFNNIFNNISIFLERGKFEKTRRNANKPVHKVCLRCGH